MTLVYNKFLSIWEEEKTKSRWHDNQIFSISKLAWIIESTSSNSIVHNLR